MKVSLLCLYNDACSQRQRKRYNFIDFIKLWFRVYSHRMCVALWEL